MTAHFAFVGEANIRRLSSHPMFDHGAHFFAASIRARVRRGVGLIGLSVALGASEASAHGTFDTRLAGLNEQLARQPQDPALHFNLAELYCEHEEPTRALEELQRVRVISPGKFSVDYLTGMCLRQAGQPAEALVALNRFVLENPENSAARLQRARVHSDVGNLFESLADYRAALRFSTRLEPDLVQEAADALAAAGRGDEAVEVLDAGLRALGPIPSLTLRALDLEILTGRFDAALARVDVLEKAAPRREAWMAKRAVVLGQAGRMDESRAAWAVLAAHLKALPNLERGSHAMSVLAEQAQRALAVPVEPVTEGDGASAKVPAKPLFPSRSALGEGSNYEEELDRVDRLIEKTPADAALHFQRAELLLLDGKRSEARANCDETDRLAPGQYATDRLRGQLLAAEGKLAESKLLLDDFIAVHTEDGLALVARARVLVGLQQVAAALADYRAALVRLPNPDPDFYQEMATALSANGQGTEARGILNAGLAKNTGLPSLVMQALDLEVAQGDFAAALARVEQLQHSAPRPEFWLARRAALLAQAGRVAEARVAWLTLHERIAALPNLERGAASMRALDAQALGALALR